MIDEFADLLRSCERDIHDDARTGGQWIIIVQGPGVFRTFAFAETRVGLLAIDERDFADAEARLMNVKVVALIGVVDEYPAFDRAIADAEIGGTIRRAERGIVARLRYAILVDIRKLHTVYSQFQPRTCRKQAEMCPIGLGQAVAKSNDPYVSSWQRNG